MIGSRLGIFEEGLAVDTLRVDDFEQTGRSMAKTELGDVERFLGLMEKPLLEDLHLCLRRPHLLKMLRDGLLQFLLKAISLRLRLAMRFPSPLPISPCRRYQMGSGTLNPAVMDSSPVSR
jgi:hypothetical protein